MNSPKSSKQVNRDNALSAGSETGSPYSLFGSDGQAATSEPSVDPVIPGSSGAGAGLPPDAGSVAADTPEPDPDDLDAIIEAKRAALQRAEQAALDPFDLDSLRLTQDFGSAVGVRRKLVYVPVRKPSKEWFVRTHSDESYRLATAVLELKEDREYYLVTSGLRAELESEPTVSPRLLVLAVSRQGNVFVWPVRLPGPDGRLDSWSQSALDASNAARTEWVRVKANMSIGTYDLDVASFHAEPVWPDLPLRKILEIAFRDKVISDWNHPILKRLRGEI